VASKKRKRLDATIAFIQGKWGVEAIRQGRPANSTAEIPHIPTGFASLDKALAGIGGIPRSRLTEFLGAPTSGMATLALKIISKAQAAKDVAAYIDLGATFDPDYASRCHVHLSKLLLVRPQNGYEALEITHTLIRSRGIGVLVFDSVAHLLADPQGAQKLSIALRQLPQALAQSPCAAIFLTPLQSREASSLGNYPSGFALPHYATVRLLLAKERWLYRGDDVRGYEARVQVTKNKLGAANKTATIAITFNGVVKGDST
jgi:recombination protein RecA